jgi:hypothetical protein
LSNYGDGARSSCSRLHPLKYWDEAFLATTYLINRTPTNVLSYDTPLHKLLGATLDYSSFHVFGCACCPICARIIPINCNSIPPVVSSLITVICKRASSAWKFPKAASMYLTMSSPMSLFSLLHLYIPQRVPVTTPMFFLSQPQSQGITILLMSLMFLLCCCVDI